MDRSVQNIYIPPMARPKEFDKETALRRAVLVFRDQGYGGVSTDTLLTAMQIGRQSMYDTFGDKRGLYLAAVDYYNTESIGEQIRLMKQQKSALKGIQAMLRAYATKTADDASLACLGISAACEFGQSDPELTALLHQAGQRLLAAIGERLDAAKAAGEINRETDAAAAAQFMLVTLTGMKMASRSGATPGELQKIADLAMRSLL